MKKTLFIILISGILYYLLNTLAPSTTDAAIQKTPVTKKGKLPLHICFFQDVSGSIFTNGVEIIPPAVFTAYRDAFDRDIRLDYGIIQTNSAGKLITVHLPAVSPRPTFPDLAGLSPPAQRRVKTQYLHDLNRYIADSAERNRRFISFCQRVEVLIEPYQQALTLKKNGKPDKETMQVFSDETDLKTAAGIASKAFGWKDNFKNFLLLNSDGLGSHGPLSRGSITNAAVLLIGANSILKTSVDSIVTKRLQSVEDAIAYSLNK